MIEVRGDFYSSTFPQKIQLVTVKVILHGSVQKHFRFFCQEMISSYTGDVRKKIASISYAIYGFQIMFNFECPLKFSQEEMGQVLQVTLSD